MEDSTTIEETAAECEFIIIEPNGYTDDVVTVKLNRPTHQNALNTQLRRELKAVCSAIDDAKGIKGVVLTGSEKSETFAAGGDVREIQERTMLEQRQALKRPRIYETVDELSIPVIARITGYALGGGCELALSADIRVAHSNAVLGLPEINLGIIPGGGGTQRLPRLVGEGQAMRLILTGEFVDASEALEIGLIDFVCEDAIELDTRVSDLADGLAGKSSIALETAKKAIRASSRMSLEEGLEYEAELFAMLFATGEKNEGIDAFLEDRSPNWRY